MAAQLTPFALETELGRLHAWSRAAGTQAGHPPLLCLHPLPFDGAFFDAAAPWLGARRDLICPDYPGFGGSEPLPEPWSVEAWAAAFEVATARLLPKRPVDVLGFHTGCLVGVQLALAAPGRVRRLVLVDVPYFDTEQRQAVAARITNAPRYVGKPHAVQGFRAAFAWDPLPGFRRLAHPTLVIGGGTDLHGPSEAAARAAPGARFLGRPDLVKPVFETGGAAIGACCDAFLGSDPHRSLPPGPV